MGAFGTVNPYRVFHKGANPARERVRIILVRPENGGNVGSICRAMANMGLTRPLNIVSSPDIINGEAEKMAKHAKPALSQILFHQDLRSALESEPSSPKLSLAATARIGSAHRPHPLWVRPAIEKAMEKLLSDEIKDLALVFGPESDGLSNDEVGMCDWVVTIPSSETYRSLNLSQSVLVFAHEINTYLVQQPDQAESLRPSQKRKLIEHLLKLGEASGFIHAGDPFKMRPRLEEILGHLPNHIRDVRTLHGWIDQIIRSVKKGEPDFKGRYRQAASEQVTQEKGYGN